MIQLEGITKSFGSLQVLRGIDMQIQKGEVVSIVGPSGAGKTTFIRKILGTENTKFPTTRQSRTTIAPTEYVICKSPNYELTILLKSFDEINGYVREILKEALEKSLKSASPINNTSKIEPMR